MKIATKNIEESTTELKSWIDRLEKLPERDEREWRTYFLRNNMWIEDIESIGYYMQQAHESVVYKGYSETEVFKLKQCGMDGTYIGAKSFIDTLQSALWHNSLFPETYYTLVGFASYGIGIRAVLRQGYVKGEKATTEQIKEFLTANGFTSITTIQGFAVSAKKDEFIVSDIHRDNAIVVDGQVHIIDSQIFQNK